MWGYAEANPTALAIAVVVIVIAAAAYLAKRFWGGR
jgi:hypothetical protein